jgi:hypothetical protein
MSSRIPDTHAEAWNLLPWLANDRLQATDREWVEAHVHGCAECRAELEAQRQVSSQMRAAGASPSGAVTPSSMITNEQRSFDKLWSRIEAAESAAPAPALTGTHGGTAVAHGNTRTGRTVRWLAAAVVVQGFGLALFGLNALRESDAPQGAEFRTVSSVEPNAGALADVPSVRLVFAPGATIDHINTLLSHQGLSIVSGPGLSGNFTAALSAETIASGASAESVAAVISKDPNVTFAQAIAR